MCATLFMFIGYKAQMYKQRETKSILIPVCILIWAVALYFSYTSGHMNVVRSFYPDLIVNIIGSVAATYVIVCISRWIEKVGKGVAYQHLLYWGRNTLIALCAHLTELNCLPWSKVYSLIDSRPVGLVIVFCLKVLWATLAVLLVNKYGKRITSCLSRA